MTPARHPFRPLLRAVAALAALAAVVALALGPGMVLAQMTLPPSEEGRYVYDVAEIWPPDTEARAQSIAESIRTRTQAQLAIVSWPSEDFDVSTETARADAITIMNTWGVGRAGVNDGLVVLFDMDNGSANHGQIYLYAGSGFEDDYLNRDEISVVVNEAMLPAAREGDIDRALLAGLDRVDHAAQPNGNPDRAGQALLLLVLGALVLGAGLLVFGAFLRTWWAEGRDAEVPLIDDSVLMPVPPPGLTPALATALRNDGIDKEAFTSALVDLGHRGLVTFEEAEDDRKQVDLVVPPSPLIDPGSLEARRRPLGDAEDDLARSIAAKSRGGVLAWTSLKAGEGAKLWESFKGDLGRAAKRSGYFREDPNRLPGRWVGIALGLFVAVVAFGFLFVFDMSEESQLFRPGRGVLGIPMIASVVLGVLVIVLSGKLVARTAEGARTLAMALGYRNTLRWELKRAHTVDEAVESAKQRLPWITTPDLLTVWAVAFGLKDEIDDLIQETFETARQTGAAYWSPAWYHGSGGIGSVGSMASSIGSISTSATSSSGSGYGGGSSGGGGGAGGGF
jgi:uncharacterized membrane protein YgcG